MRRINTTVEIEMSTKTLGEILVEVRIDGCYAPASFDSPEEFPDVSVEQLTLYDEDGKPYSGDIDRLETKEGVFTLRDEIEEKAIEKWREMDDCDDDRDEDETW